MKNRGKRNKKTLVKVSSGQLGLVQSINQSIIQSFYFRNKPISEINRKTGVRQRKLLKLLKPIKT